MLRPQRGLLALAVATLIACTATPAPHASTGRPPVRSSPAGPQPRVAAPPIVVDVVGAPWTRAIDRVVAGRNVSVAVGIGDRILFVHAGGRPRRLASNEKLLTSMAALEILGSGHRFRTIVAATDRPVAGVLDGDLWLIGGGDPEFGATDIDGLAARLLDAGLRRVTGSVLGDRGAFDRGWWAPGWLPGISRHYVTRPTALAWGGNVAQDPEAAAAAALASALRDAGVVIDGAAGSGRAPAGVATLASDGSAPLAEILLRQNHDSVNLDAEIITKALGALSGRGSTATGARVIQAWAQQHSVAASVRDGSGLSNQDRTSAAGLVSLLLGARRRAWFPDFLASLPAPGTGTLSGRLAGVPLRAKTGTLFARPTSALSGYVRTVDGAMAAFAILTEGLGSWGGEAIEDAVVRILAGAHLETV